MPLEISSLRGLLLADTFLRDLWHSLRTITDLCFPTIPLYALGEINAPFRNGSTWLISPYALRRSGRPSTGSSLFTKCLKNFFVTESDSRCVVQFLGHIQHMFRYSCNLWVTLFGTASLFSSSTPAQLVQMHQFHQLHHLIRNQRSKYQIHRWIFIKMSAAFSSFRTPAYYWKSKNCPLWSLFQYFIYPSMFWSRKMRHWNDFLSLQQVSEKPNVSKYFHLLY